MTAIEQGIITDTTKGRLLELEARQSELTAKIAAERADIITISREDVIAGLEMFRDGEITDKKYQAKLFDTFLVAVYVYDDDLKIVFSFTGNKNTVSVPLDASIVENVGNNAEGECSFKPSFEPPVEGLDTQFVLKSYANLKLAARPKGSDLRGEAPPT